MTHLPRFCIATLFLLLAASTASAQFRWQVINPSPAGIDARQLLHLGGDSYMLRSWNRIAITTDGGTTWEVQWNPGSAGGTIRALAQDSPLMYAAGDAAGRTELIPVTHYVEPQPRWEGVSIDVDLVGILTYRNTSAKALLGSNGIIYHWENARDTTKIQTPSTATTAIASGGDKIYFVATADGAVLKSTNRGTSWTRHQLSSGAIRAIDVSIFANVVVAAGDNGALFSSRDSGNTWQSCNTGTTSTLRGVAVLGQVVAVGDSGTIVTGDPFGTDFTIVPPVTRHNLNAVDFAYPTKVVAVGDSGAIVVGDPSQNVWQRRYSGSYGHLYAVSIGIQQQAWTVAAGEYGEVVQSDDTGRTWRVSERGYTGTISNIDFLTPSIGLTAAANSMLRTSDSGRSWHPFAQLRGEKITGLRYIDADTVIAVGPAGWIGRSTDGGRSWIQVPSSTRQELYDAYFFDSRNGFVVGYETLLRTSNGGRSWQREAPPLLPTPSYGDLYRSPDGSMFLTSASFDTVIIYKYTDGSSPARHVFRFAPPGGTIARVKSMHFRDALNATAIIMVNGYQGVSLPSYLLRTTDVGETWSYEPAGPGTLRDLNYMAFRDSDNGLAMTGSGEVYRTSDAGASWTPIAPPLTLAQLRMVASNRMGVCVAVSDSGQVIRSSDAGQSWQLIHKEPYPLRAIDFASRDTAFAVGDSGLVVRSIDAGATWSRLDAPTTQPFVGVDFIDTKDGIAVGRKGLILTTHDGGATWRWPDSANGKYPNLDFIRVTMVDSLRIMLYGAPFPGSPESTTRMRSTDGGRTWKKMTSANFARLEVVGNVVTGIASNGSRSFSYDGGNTWQSRTPFTSEGVVGMASWDSEHVVAIKDYTILSSVAADRWRRDPVGAGGHIGSICWADSTTVVAVGDRGLILRGVGVHEPDPVAYEDPRHTHVNERASHVAAAKLVAVRPNPASNVVTLEISIPTGFRASLSLLDHRGNIVSVVPIEQLAPGANRSIEIVVNDLPSGSYIYRLILDGDVGTVPLVETGIVSVVR